MTEKLPVFVTKDLPETPEGEAEFLRRWQAYDREMKAIIEAGDVHQDEDGWWIVTATGEMIGPDPEIERPLTETDLAAMKPARDVLPASFMPAIEEARRKRGRPPLKTRKQLTNIRLDQDVLKKLKDGGPGWQTRANNILRKEFGL